MEKRPKILFLSTNDSTRSQMAEGFTKAYASDQMLTTSPGIGSDAVNPIGVEVMKESGIDTSTHRPKNLKQTFDDHFGWVVVLYDAAKERAPVFPFTRNLLRWSIPDPVTVEGSGEVKRAMFRGVRDDVKARVEAFLKENALINPRAA